MVKKLKKNIDKRLFGKLVKKYNYKNFVYVEYPHKSFWSEEFGESDFKKALNLLASSEKAESLMLYVHIPFCERQCFYCTCHTKIINRDNRKIKNYLDLLLHEIDIYQNFFKKNSINPNFKEIHFGGGSPTILNKKDFDRLIEKVGTIVDMKNLREFSLEVDPRGVDKEKMKYYYDKGINRISFGIQDFDIRVQKVINRIQPPELVENLVTPDIRNLFEHGINFDILCGLPNQTSESMRNTFKKIIKFSPERVCFSYFNYAPKFAKHQEIMIDGKNGRPTRLPNAHERKILFKTGLEILVNNGYLRAGYDHFVRPDDEIVEAIKNKKMGWNGLGITSGSYTNIIGIGVHSTSTIGNYYSQNVYGTEDYKAFIENDRFPIYRGYKLNDNDMIRRDIIRKLRNFFSLDYNDIEKKYDINFKEYFKKEITALDNFVKDGIVEVFDDGINVTELGREFIQFVCGNFDSYITTQKK